MRSMWLALTLLFIASLSTFPETANSSQPENTISGTVLGEHGQPFKGVQVCTATRDAPARSRESRGDCPAATTDEAGQFPIDHVAMGAIHVQTGTAYSVRVRHITTSTTFLVSSCCQSQRKWRLPMRSGSRHRQEVQHLRGTQ